MGAISLCGACCATHSFHPPLFALLCRRCHITLNLFALASPLPFPSISKNQEYRDSELRASPGFRWIISFLVFSFIFCLPPSHHGSRRLSTSQSPSDNPVYHGTSFFSFMAFVHRVVPIPTKHCWLQSAEPSVSRKA